MRLSCCAYSYRQALQGGAMTLPQFLTTCREIGFDGVELTAYYFPTTERAFLNEIKLQAHREGLAISGTAVGSDFAQPDAEKRRAHVTMTLEWIERTVILGAPTLRVFAGPVREGQTGDEAFYNAVTCLQECAAAAQMQGVLLALENHGGLTGTAEGTLRLLHAVNSPALGLNLDFGNFSLHGGDIYGQFTACAPHAVVTHVKPTATLTPGKPETREEVDYRRVRDILATVDYRGFLAMEYEEEEPAETAVPRFAAALRAALGR
jgi:sugar phosphate isomerase/epimerase